MDHYVEREEIRVLRVLADWKGGGPAEAMHRLESKLPSLRGRKFYGTFRMLPEGEEYFACVQRVETDDPQQMHLDEGTIPGGLYLRRKLTGWQDVIAAGRLGEQFQEMVRSCRPDRSRPSIEFYRSMSEMHLLEPVLDRSGPAVASPEGAES
jgi:hypothetical protein